jgi:hypothetical protein
LAGFEVTTEGGTVCTICNNGWMSRLEAEVKPILIPLIDDPRRMEALGLHQRTTIARWAVKTVAVLNRASAFGSSGNEMSRPVPNDHLTDVMNGRLPSGVAVLGCGYPSSKLLDWLQLGTWMAPSNRIPLREADRNRGYKIALAFRDLVAGCLLSLRRIPLWCHRRELLFDVGRRSTCYTNPSTVR